MTGIIGDRDDVTPWDERLAGHEKDPGEWAWLLYEELNKREMLGLIPEKQLNEMRMLAAFAAGCGWCHWHQLPICDVVCSACDV